jgi:hypothetical protein
MRVIARLPSLRRLDIAQAIGASIRRGNTRRGFRVVHFSIQATHLHFVVEGAGRRTLANGLRGLAVRVARAVNRALRRCGRVMASRYHARALRTPTEVRNALVYVLANFKHHEWDVRGIDLCSSARWFDGWRERRPDRNAPVAAPITWLLRTGWRRKGLVSVDDWPVS